MTTETKISLTFSERPRMNDLTEFGEAVDMIWSHFGGFTFEKTAHWLDISTEKFALILTGKSPIPNDFMKNLKRSFRLTDEQIIHLEKLYSNHVESIKAFLDEMRENLPQSASSLCPR